MSIQGGARLLDQSSRPGVLSTGEREEGSLADGPISSSVMVWAVICTAFAMPCLALAALFWRAGQDGSRAKSPAPPRLSAKYRFRLNKPPTGSARAAPKQRRDLKRIKH
jgi:hypothetical protein